jgi:hypothetical protein
MVLYNASGTHVAASYFNGKNLDSWFVADAKLYYCYCHSEEEAHYLAAILNSSVADERIKPFQSLGLIGERDIHKKVLDLPIPIFNRSKPLHAQLAHLGSKAYEEASKFTAEIPKTSSLARKREAVRESISSTIKEIDELVEELLSAIDS